MRAEIDIQVVWSENKGEVQLFFGDFRIGLPPVLCEQLENELAAARRIPKRAQAMCNHDAGDPLSLHPAGSQSHDAGGDGPRNVVSARQPQTAKTE